QRRICRRVVTGQRARVRCAARDGACHGVASRRGLFLQRRAEAKHSYGPGGGFFKPQWSPDLLLSTNYIGQFWCARGDLVGRVAATGGLPLTEPYDLVLRLPEAAQAIRPVPLVLCERAVAPPDRSEQDMRALDSAAARRGIPAAVQPGLVPSTYRL